MKTDAFSVNEQQETSGSKGYLQENSGLQQPYRYSMKVETEAKGVLAPSVHVYGDNPYEVRHELVEQYTQLVQDFKKVGIPVVGGAADNGE